MKAVDPDGGGSNDNEGNDIGGGDIGNGIIGEDGTDIPSGVSRIKLSDILDGVSSSSPSFEFEKIFVDRNYQDTYTAGIEVQPDVIKSNYADNSFSIDVSDMYAYGSLTLTSVSGIYSMLSSTAAIGTFSYATVVTGGIFGIIGMGIVLSGLVYEFAKTQKNPPNPLLKITAVNNIPGQAAFMVSLVINKSASQAFDHAQLVSDVRSIYRLGGMGSLKTNTVSSLPLRSRDVLVMQRLQRVNSGVRAVTNMPEHYQKQKKNLSGIKPSLSMCFP